MNAIGASMIKMAPAQSELRKVRFGNFEVDFEIRELRKGGVRLKLQRKPFQILEILLRNPGCLVTRDELMQQLWPNLHVNFEGGLNTAMNSLRQALGDSPRNCRFIETRPGLGYRFLGTVEPVIETGDTTSANSTKRNAKSASTSSEAHQDYLRGKYFYNKMTEDDLRKSMAHFNAAIAEDSQFALAYAGLADAYSACAVLGSMPPLEARDRALQMTNTALEIDSELPQVLVSLARIKMLFERDWTGAEADYRAALRTDPTYAAARQSYAGLLAALGRTEAALNEIRWAQDSDPLSLAVGVERAWILYMARDFQSASEQAWKTLALEPKFAAAQHALGLAYQQSGMFEEAVAEFENARLCSGDSPGVKAALGHAYASAERWAEAGQALEALQEMSERRYVSPYWKAIVHCGLRSSGQALQCLEEAYAQNDVWLLWLKAEPRLDPLRGDARFASLVNRVGLNNS